MNSRILSSSLVSISRSLIYTSPADIFFLSTRGSVNINFNPGPTTNFTKEFQAGTITFTWKQFDRQTFYQQAYGQHSKKDALLTNRICQYYFNPGPTTNFTKEFEAPPPLVLNNLGDIHFSNRQLTNRVLKETLSSNKICQF